jgi:hypothetical protein
MTLSPPLSAVAIGVQLIVTFSGSMSATAIEGLLQD